MSVVIIGNGDENRAAIQEFEQASLTWTPGQRAIGEAMLREHAHRLRAYIKEVKDNKA